MQSPAASQGRCAARIVLRAAAESESAVNSTGHPSAWRSVHLCVSAIAVLNGCVAVTDSDANQKLNGAIRGKQEYRSSAPGYAPDDSLVFDFVPEALDTRAAIHELRSSTGRAPQEGEVTDPVYGTECHVSDLGESLRFTAQVGTEIPNVQPGAYVLAVRMPQMLDHTTGILWNNVTDAADEVEVQVHIGSETFVPELAIATVANRAAFLSLGTYSLEHGELVVEIKGLDGTVAAHHLELRPVVTPNVRNTSWSAFFSMLAYEAYEDVETLFLELGFEQSWGFDITEAHQLIPHDTQAFLAYDADQSLAVLAFRGTAGRRDVQTDALFDLEDPYLGDGWGRSHRGFRNALEIARPQITEALERLPAETRIVVTGHSLGAALATLMTAHLVARPRADVNPHNVVALHTFGSPRVANDDFARRFTQETSQRRIETTRVRFATDAVTRVPLDLDLPSSLILSYKHVGHMFFLDEVGCSSFMPPEGISLRLRDTFSNHRIGGYLSQLVNLDRTNACAMATP